jgi:heme-degrading monooxygenase HmoA
MMSMALFRIPLSLNKKITFYKLMGSGKNGTFDIRPDWRQWAILAAHPTPPQSLNTAELLGGFIAGWLRFFGCEVYTMFLEPLEGHGRWDGREPFGHLSRKTGIEGPVAVLTRATIRLSKLRSFWRNVEPVASQMAGADGFITSFGIGEVPYIKQATFSVWQSQEHMKSFAYALKSHREVIQKTRRENWYSEDMFVRFRIVDHVGSIRGADPLKGMRQIT